MHFVERISVLTKFIDLGKNGVPGKSEILIEFIEYLDFLINRRTEACFLNTASTILYVFILGLS